jgi:predicted dehydrogenase
MDPLRFGVIGLNFGQFHVRTLAHLPEARLVAVADKTAGHLDSLADQYGAKAYRDGLDMIDGEELDAVIVATSPKYRDPILARAAAGLPMFVEKPWATNSAHAEKLAAICREAGATVMLGFSFRFLPAVVKLRELMAGELGEGWLAIGGYMTDWLPPAEHWLWDPENGGGYFNENSCHLFDVVNALLGRPVSLYAEGRDCTGKPSEDAALVTVRYESAAIASVAVGGVAASAFQDFPSLEVITANGQARLTGRQHIWTGLSWARREESAVHRTAPPPESLGDTRYTRALQHFCQCIREGREPEATIEDGVLCVRMAEAVYESARSGGLVELAATGGI